MIKVFNLEVCVYVSIFLKGGKGLVLNTFFALKAKTKRMIELKLVSHNFIFIINHQFRKREFDFTLILYFFIKNFPNLDGIRIDQRLWWKVNIYHFQWGKFA